MANEKSQKIPNIYCCKSCDYNTSNKKDYDKHLFTAKHQRLTNANDFSPQKSLDKIKYLCNCGKEYKHSSSLCKHKNICKFVELDKNDITDKELIMMLLKQNSQLIEQNSELTKNGINNTSHSHNTTNTNSLNETCKDAMNIMDFVDSIKLQLSDLENVGKFGYVEGISNIITSNLKALDITQRPVHCADKKREVIYVKDENKWEKDEEKNKLKKAIKKVASKNFNLIPKFKEAYPDYGKSSAKISDKYNKIIIESCGGAGDNDLEKEDKIIKNISNVTLINKT